MLVNLLVIVIPQSYVFLRNVGLVGLIVGVQVGVVHSLLLQQILLFLTVGTANHAGKTKVGFLTLLSLLNRGV